MNKTYALQELDILKNEINDKLKWYNEHPEETDPDTLGTEIEYSKKMISVIDNMKNMVTNDIPEDDGETHYMFSLFNRLQRGMPATCLEDIDARPNEWETEPKYGTFYNKRYGFLIRLPLKLSNDKSIDVYHDEFRFEFYDILRNQKVSRGELPSKFILSVLDQLIPIEFPYDPDTDHIKVYIELFECSLQEDAKPVKTLGITHYMTNVSDRPEKIFKFFDITGDTFEEIEWKAYATRRQIYDKTIEVVKEVKNDENSKDE